MTHFEILIPAIMIIVLIVFYKFYIKDIKRDILLARKGQELDLSKKINKAIIRFLFGIILFFVIALIGSIFCKNKISMIINMITITFMSILVAEHAKVLYEITKRKALHDDEGNYLMKDKESRAPF